MSGVGGKSKCSEPSSLESDKGGGTVGKSRCSGVDLKAEVTKRRIASSVDSAKGSADSVVASLESLLLEFTKGSIGSESEFASGGISPDSALLESLLLDFARGGTGSVSTSLGGLFGVARCCSSTISCPCTDV